MNKFFLALLLFFTALYCYAGKFIDPRDGQVYKTVQLGDREWFAQNLNFKTDSSWCYNDSLANCETYGRLYNWDAAMKACPSGWRLPAKSDFESWMYFKEDRCLGCSKLRAKSGWDTNGPDIFGFSALPAGCRLKEGDYSGNQNALFWLFTEDDSLNAMHLDLEFGNITPDEKLMGLSVRCVSEEKKPSNDRVFTDPRDGQKYKTVKIADREWFAQNLNFKTDSSWCYNDSLAYCQKFGRLYNWDAAMNACPDGWLLPTEQEFRDLLDIFGDYDLARELLKSRQGWRGERNGVDFFGFNGLSAGERNGRGYFDGIVVEGGENSKGLWGSFWSATPSWEKALGMTLEAYVDDESFMIDRHEKDLGFSVRCIKDNEPVLKKLQSQLSELRSAIIAKNDSSKLETWDGFSYLDMGETRYKGSGDEFAYMTVNSDPAGAIFSVDGRFNNSCSKTPCNIVLKKGDHRFSFASFYDFAKDTVVTVNKNFHVLNVNLVSYVGTITLNPKLAEGIGDTSGIKILEHNTFTEHIGTRRRGPGKYSFKISHPCYEDAFFDVNLKMGSHVTFDRELAVAQGTLQLNATENGMPKVAPVFVNGTKVGETPFFGTLPLCNKITIGDQQEELRINLKKHETVTYTHELKNSSSKEKVAGEGVLIDPQDGQEYRTVKIGNQVWMAQNLNYAIGNSACYEDKPSNCEKYGRLYDWYSAQNACPAGWHLPSTSEFDTLINFVGGEGVAGTKLKAKSGWPKEGSSYGNGTDDYGFSAVPTGSLSFFIADFEVFERYFSKIGKESFYWTTTESENNGRHYAYRMVLTPFPGFRKQVNAKEQGFPVRCVKDSD